jgi:hypothetical protein
VPQAFVRLSALVATLMCDDEKTQGCLDSSAKNIGSNYELGFASDGTGNRLSFMKGT